MPPSLADIERALAPSGMIVRGGFHPTADDAVPNVTGDASLILVGNAGSAMWHPFAAAWPAARRDFERHPLNVWTRDVIDPIAADFGGRALYPFDGPPYLPFQRWAVRAEGIHASPLGLLLHPVYGLWHAYRAALVFDDRLSMPDPADVLHPCLSCAGKTCLAACPVGAFQVGHYDVPACAEHLCGNEAEREDGCMDRGCLARRACAIGQQYHYLPPHARFHMQKFRLTHTGC